MGANPNVMTFKQVFHAEYQMSHFKQPVYQVLADTRFESGLTKGQTLNRSYASDVVVNTMGADGSYSTQAITDSQETLTIDKEKEASIYIKKLDELQAHLPVKQKYAKKLVHALINQIDGDVLLAAYQGATTSLSDGDFAGTAGNGITVSASNVATMFTLAMQKLMKNNVVYNANARFSGGQLEVPEGMPMAVITPEVLTFIQLYLGGKDTMLGDRVSTNGFKGSFMGFELFISNALPWTATLELPTIPTAGDTLVINGVTLTAAADGAATNAGDYSIQAAVDNAAASLVQLINGTGTPGADNYIELSAANRAKLKNITAAYDTGTNLLTLVSSGWGVVEVSETFTPAGNVFTSGLEIIHCIFGLSKSVTLVVQKDPSLEENFVSGKIGRDYIAWTVYGTKVFKDQVPQLIDVKVLSTSFVAGATAVN
jgi:hypothetical protein